MKIEIIIQDGYRESLRIYEEHESNGMYTANRNIEEANHKKAEGHVKKKDGEKVLDVTDVDGDEGTCVHKIEEEKSENNRFDEKIELDKKTIERLVKAIRETTPKGDSINDTKKFFSENQVGKKLMEKYKEITGQELKEGGLYDINELKETIEEINKNIEEDAEKVNKEREEDDEHKVPWPTDY